MPLVSLKQLLIKAQKEQYAVGSFNVLDIQSARGVIQAAEEERSPVILAFGEGHERFIPIDLIFTILKKLGKEATVPVVVLLDHGSFEVNLRVMDLGITATMYDGSALPFERNIENTRKIVEKAHALGIDVEAELGHVSMEEGNPDKLKTQEDETIYTDPTLVREFVEKTGLDALAISIGTIHGVCLEKPKIDFQRLKEIRHITDIPLVLHGGSGVSDEDFKRCIKEGITKINYFSEISHFVGEKIKDRLQKRTEKNYYQDIVKWSQELFKERVINRIRLFGSSKKA
ncbi:MAG: class II fructose-bisphosphate aldolase [Promethearchaeota archaeon]